MRKRSVPRASGSGGSAVARPAPSQTKTAKGVRSWLPSSSSFAVSEAVTLGAIVTYDVMSATATKLPRPGPIVATLGFYAMLAAVGSISRTFEPVAVAVGWVISLAVLVTGKRGAGIVGLLRSFAGWTQNLGAGQSAPATSGG